MHDYRAMVAFDDGYEKGHREGWIDGLKCGKANIELAKDNAYYKGFDKGFMDGARVALRNAGWTDETIQEWFDALESDGYNEADYRP